MAGLLEKDIRLIMQRKQMLLLFVVIAVVLGFHKMVLLFWDICLFAQQLLW